MLESIIGKIGAGLTEVLGWYIKRAPTEVVDAVFAASLLTTFVLVGKWALKRVPNWDDLCWQNVLGIAMMILSFCALFVLLMEIPEAYKAMMAPEAYGLDKLLKHWR